MPKSKPKRSNVVFEQPSGVKTLADYKAMFDRLGKALGFEPEMSEEEWQQAFEEFMEALEAEKRKNGQKDSRAQ